MLRFTVFASLLLSFCAAGNAGQISPLDRGNTLKSQTASSVRELMGLTGVENPAYVPLDVQANMSSRAPARPLALTASPEPGSCFLFGAGLVLIGVVRRRARA
jgi:hypothetical protein